MCTFCICFLIDYHDDVVAFGIKNLAPSTTSIFGAEELRETSPPHMTKRLPLAA